MVIIELWALLHFIMPSLFDSHDEFNEWFSKDIENAAENKGNRPNEHQLRRLHMILKPFMLRRVKRHVQNELSEKVDCILSSNCYPINNVTDRERYIRRFEREAAGPIQGSACQCFRGRSAREGSKHW